MLEAASALLPVTARPTAARHRDALIQRGFLQPPRFEESTADCEFRHALIREACYRSIPKQLRADLHKSYAEWRARVAGERADDSEIRGYHLEHAYRYRAELGAPDEATEALGRLAAGLLAAAGKRAERLGDPRAAANLL